MVQKIMCICICLCLLCGCSQLVDRLGVSQQEERQDSMVDPQSDEQNSSDEETIASARLSSLLTACENQDVDTVLGMFSQQAIEETEDLQQGVEDLFSMINEKVVSQERLGGYTGSEINKESTSKKTTFSFKVATENAQYIICISECISDENSDNVGVYQIIAYDIAYLGQISDCPDFGIYVKA